MDALQVKVLNNKVCIGYISLFDPEDSFYGEFNLDEYKQRLENFKKDHKPQIFGDLAKLKFSYVNKDIHISLSKNGIETLFSGKNLADMFFI